MHLGRSVDHRERWQALQHHLKHARTALEAGDRAAALQHANAALALDPAFLAAQTLRERIVAMEPAAVVPRHAAAPIAIAAPAVAAAGPAVQRSAAPRPYSPDGLAQFEARARQRRLERRLKAAQDAVAARQFVDARAAIEEIRELDPAHPELASIVSALDAAERPEPLGTERPRRRRRRRRVGPFFAAAAVFAGLMFAAPWIDRRGPSPPVQPPSRVEVAVAVPDLPVPTTGADATTADAAPALADTVEVPPPSETAPPAPARFVRSVNIAPTPLPLPSSSSAAAFSNVSPPVVPAAELRFDPPPPAALSPSANVSRELAAAPLPAPHPPPAALEPAAAAAIVPPRADDEQLVKDVLQRYRAAYDELDARRARAVWPGVNETALERAFQDLESQSLTFDACEVKLRGAAATATCRGTARYVPKVGSREPRVESRVWTFTLQKAGEAWQIQNARAER